MNSGQIILFVLYSMEAKNLEIKTIQTIEIR